MNLAPLLNLLGFGRSFLAINVPNCVRPGVSIYVHHVVQFFVVADFVVLGSNHFDAANNAG